MTMKRCVTCGNPNLAVQVDAPWPHQRRWYCRKHLNHALDRSYGVKKITVTNLTNAPVNVYGVVVDD